MNRTLTIGYQICDKTFQKFRDLLHQESGIVLSDEKKSLVISRLSKRLRTLGLESFEGYYAYVTSRAGAEEFVVMIDSLLTNKTDFFREPIHFKFLLEHILPKRQQERKICIWSAGCSSGEEPYSIAMVVNDALVNSAEWDVRILASDLSTRILEKASKGIYEIDQARDLSPTHFRNHFLKGRGKYAGQVKVKQHISKRVVFRQINLMDHRYPIKTPIDLIFCRNVMIYFDPPTQEGLIARLHHYLRPGGYLFVGHSESFQHIKGLFHLLSPTIYQKESV